MCLLWVYLQPKTLEPNEQEASYESRRKGDPMRRANVSPHTPSRPAIGSIFIEKSYWMRQKGRPPVSLISRQFSSGRPVHTCLFDYSDTVCSK